MEAELLERIKLIVSVGNFRLGPHVTRHMYKEGLSENDLIEAMTGKCRILEHYPDESRCLVIGYFQMSGNIQSPLHLVFEYSTEDEDAVDIVTAYIPQKQWWVTPWQRR